MNNDEFKVFLLNTDGMAKQHLVAETFDRALDVLKRLIPEGRYMSIVKTKMEEACFFAKKGVCFDPDNQQ